MNGAQPDVRRDGAATELRIALLPPGDARLAQALQLGLSSALAYDAGLACQADGQVVLSRRIDGADPHAVAAAREALCAQHAAWSALLDTTRPVGLAALRQPADERGRRRLLERIGAQAGTQAEAQAGAQAGALAR